MPTVSMDARGRVRIPKGLREELRAEPGDVFTIRNIHGVLELVKATGSAEDGVAHLGEIAHREGVPLEDVEGIFREVGGSLAGLMARLAEDAEDRDLIRQVREEGGPTVSLEELKAKYGLA